MPDPTAAEQKAQEQQPENPPPQERAAESREQKAERIPAEFRFVLGAAGGAGNSRQQEQLRRALRGNSRQ
jgi:hypothetical protein